MPRTITRRFVFAHKKLKEVLEIRMSWLDNAPTEVVRSLFQHAMRQALMECRAKLAKLEDLKHVRTLDDRGREVKEPSPLRN